MPTASLLCARPWEAPGPEHVFRACPPRADSASGSASASGSGSASGSDSGSAGSPLSLSLEARVDALVLGAYARHQRTMGDNEAFTAALLEVGQNGEALPRVTALSEVHTALLAADVQQAEQLLYGRKVGLGVVGAFIACVAVAAVVTTLVLS